MEHLRQPSVVAVVLGAVVVIAAVAVAACCSVHPWIHETVVCSCLHHCYYLYDHQLMSSPEIAALGLKI